MSFPRTRLSRLRRTPHLRAALRETTLAPADFILPLFARHGTAERRPIRSMPGVNQLSVDELVRDVQAAASAGVRSVMLFGVPDAKDPTGSENYSEHGIVQQAVRSIKQSVPGITVMVDLCMCEYTDHGHCGIIDGAGVINHDATLEILARATRSYADAGADIIAPSGMIDGMVSAIRAALDDSGRTDVSILSYAIKYASAFYGPFRDAAESAPSFGDRRSHQLDPANAREAMRELHEDLAEGADMVMVKPALGYLDIVQRARQATDVPVAAYNVSGEYAMVKAAAANGWIDECRTVLEVLTSIRRAGADMILTYHAVDAARWLQDGQ